VTDRDEIIKLVTTRGEEGGKELAERLNEVIATNLVDGIEAGLAVAENEGLDAEEGSALFLPALAWQTYLHLSGTCLATSQGWFSVFKAALDERYPE
jgi:hypothetical protein